MLRSPAILKAVNSFENRKVVYVLCIRLKMWESFYAVIVKYKRGDFVSTSLNDVVNELYRELQVRFDKKPVPVSKFKKFSRHPVLFFTQLWKHLRYPLYGYGSFRSTAHQAAEFNVFTPTEKIFPEAKIAVYTVITGSYDNIKQPIYADDTLDYYLITDSPSSSSETSVITQMGGGGRN